MDEDQWLPFDKSKRDTYPADGAQVIVETESGRTFSAKFNSQNADFSLYYSLWGNQGAVTRWRYPQKRD